MFLPLEILSLLVKDFSSLHNNVSCHKCFCNDLFSVVFKRVLYVCTASYLIYRITFIVKYNYIIAFDVLFVHGLLVLSVSLYYINIQQ